MKNAETYIADYGYFSRLISSALMRAAIRPANAEGHDPVEWMELVAAYIFRAAYAKGLEDGQS